MQNVQMEIFNRNDRENKEILKKQQRVNIYINMSTTTET